MATKPKTLPAITVTDSQYARLAAILPGTTAAQKTAAYTAGTLAYWKREVIDADVRAAEAAAAATLEAARAAAISNADNL